MAGTITHSWNGTILSITSDSGTTAMDLKGEKGDTGARGVRGLPGKAGGGARIEDGVISDETTWSSSGIVDRFAELMGTNANPAVLDNPYPNYPLQITTTFEPKQEGSGNPYPAGGGKNLLPDINISSGGFTSSGNGVFKYVSNNNTTISTFLFKAGITYTISATTVSGTGYKPCIIVRNPTGDKTGQKTNYGTTSNPLTFSFDTDTNFDIILQAETGNGLTTVNDSWAIQLEVGSAATEYAPYANIRPISGFDSMKLTRCGKNLFDKDSAMLNSWYSYSPDTPNANPFNGLFASKLIPVRPGEVFTLTNYLTGTGYGLVKYLVSETDTGGISGVRSGDVITCDGTKQVYTFTVPDKVRYIGITGDMANIDKVQLELGSAATEYEPYQGDTYSADFGQTVYGGTLDWQTGVLTVDKAIFTLTGEDGAKMTGTSGVRPQVFGFEKTPNILKPADGSLVADALSSHFKIVSWTELTSGSMFDAFAIHANGSIGFAYNGTISEANAWLSSQYAAGTPVQVCYKLATPQTIQLTPQEIKAIKGINTLYSNAQELTVIGRVDTMYQLSKLAERVAALEAR